MDFTAILKPGHTFLVIVQFEEELPEFFILDLNDLIPAKKSYYTWNGSFTTPPCTEGVLWILFDSMNTVSARQVKGQKLSICT